MTKQRCTFFQNLNASLSTSFSSKTIIASLSVDEWALRRWGVQLQKERTGDTSQSKALTPEQQKIQELKVQTTCLKRENSIFKNHGHTLFCDTD